MESRDSQQFTIAADHEGRITFWSSQAEQVFGWSEEDAVGLHLVKRIFERFAMSKGYGILASVLKGEAWEGQIYARKPDGSDFPVLLEFTPLLDDDGFVSGLMVAGQMLEHRAVDPTIDLKEEWFKYLLHERNLAGLTCTSYVESLERVERFCGKPARELQVGDVRRFLRESNYSPSSKSHGLTSVKSFYRWMNLEGYVDYSPIQSVSGPRKDFKKKRALTTDEARTLLEICHRPTEFRVIYLGLYAGLRVSESARVADDNWSEDRLHVFGKGRKWREVPIHEALQEQRDIILTRASNDSTLKHVCASLSHITGIRFSSHDLRHTFGRMLNEKGVERDVIGALYGHAGTVTTGYVPVTFREMSEAIKRLTYEGEAKPKLKVIED